MQKLKESCKCIKVKEWEENVGFYDDFDMVVTRQT